MSMVWWHAMAANLIYHANSKLLWKQQVTIQQPIYFDKVNYFNKDEVILANSKLFWQEVILTNRKLFWQTVSYFNKLNYFEKGEIILMNKYLFWQTTNYSANNKQFRKTAI